MLSALTVAQQGALSLTPPDPIPISAPGTQLRVYFVIAYAQVVPHYIHMLPVPPGTMAFVSGKMMFEVLLRELQSVAVHSTVCYA